MPSYFLELEPKFFIISELSHDLVPGDHPLLKSEYLKKTVKRTMVFVNDDSISLLFRNNLKNYNRRDKYTNVKPAIKS